MLESANPSDPVDKYFRKGPPPPNALVIRLTYKDNPFFDQTALRDEMELMRERNFERYRTIWEGEYDVSHESQVFTDVIIGRPAIPLSTPPRYGCDFGFSIDPSAIVKVYVIPQTRQIYVAQEASGRVPMDQLPNLIESVVADRGDLVMADNSQPGTIEFLAARGFGVIPARKGKGSVREGVQYLQGFQLVIDPSCDETANEARLYRWPVDPLSGQVRPGVNPVDRFNHHIDAIRYAISDLITAPELEDDESGGVLWLDPWNIRPRLRRADPLPASDDTEPTVWHYIPLPKRQRRDD